MRNHLAAVLAALALWSAGNCPRAMGQTLYGNINQPPVSPYLNILRGGAPPGVNYYNLVQPQLQFYSAINQLQAQQQQQAISSTNASGALITGHPIQFSNYSHFFPQQGLGVGSSSSQGFRGNQNPQNRGQQTTAARPLGTSPTAFPLGKR
jgi:hypothetical protein